MHTMHIRANMLCTSAYSIRYSEIYFISISMWKETKNKTKSSTRYSYMPAAYIVREMRSHPKREQNEKKNESKAENVHLWAD